MNSPHKLSQFQVGWGRGLGWYRHLVSCWKWIGDFWPHPPPQSLLGLGITCSLLWGDYSTVIHAKSYTLLILITLFVNISHLQLQCRHCLFKWSAAWKLTWKLCWPVHTYICPGVIFVVRKLCSFAGAYYYTFIVGSKWVNPLGIDRSRSRAPPMFVRKYVDENGSAAMLDAKRSAIVAPEMNLRNLLCADNEACKRGNPTWLWNPGQTSQTSKTGVSVAPHKGPMSS